MTGDVGPSGDRDQSGDGTVEAGEQIDPPEDRPRDGGERLSDATYRDRRPGDDGVGRAAASALLKVAEHIGPDAMTSSFPSWPPQQRLPDGELPEGFADFDRVVVDEVQDLTLLETAVVVELCLVIARRQGHAPWLLAAGDDGQTVRPSGFDWGALNDLRLAAPRRFHSKTTCATQAASPPSSDAHPSGTTHRPVTASDKTTSPAGTTARRRLPASRRGDVPTAVGLLERLEEVEGLGVVTVADEQPAWVPERLRDMVLTPADAKGLEYQSVCAAGGTRARPDEGRAGA